MFEFQLLTKAHHRTDFDCGIPSLNQYLLRSARRHADSVACAAVLVEAIDDAAQAFYEKYGFQRLNKPGRHLYLTMKKIRMLP